MGKIVAVYNVKLTVRADESDAGDIAPGLTNDEIGDVLASALSEAIAKRLTGGKLATTDTTLTLTTNVTSIERTDS